MRTPWIISIIVATLFVVACKHNYKQEWRGNTPVRIRNLSASSVESVRFVPESEHDPSGNWLTQPIPAGGEVTFTIKDGGYWFNAKGNQGIDTGTSTNSAFGKLIVVKGAMEIVLFDRNTPATETTNGQSRLTFAFDTQPIDAPTEPGMATPPAPTPTTPPAGSGSAAAPPPS